MPSLRALRLLVPLSTAVLLAACDGGGGGGPITEPAPRDTLERLLTDAEIATTDDGLAPAENPAWTQWVAANHHPVRSLTSTTDFADLQFLEPLLAGRRVVQLGESGHGVRQFNQAKVRLIRFLHEEMGYDVIAFESSLHDCWWANGNLPALSAEDLMRECPFGVWHTEEVLPLMRYVRERAATSRPLVLAGVDVQPSSRWQAGRKRSELLREVLAAVAPDVADSLGALDGRQAEMMITNVAAYAEFVRANADSLLRAYGRAEAILRQNEAVLADRFRAQPDKPRVALATVSGWSAFVRQMVAPTSAGRYSARDEGMAANLDFLLDAIYPGKKVIVWGHNSHLAKRHSQPGFVNMGSHVHARRGAEVYTVGLYMYMGQAADNSRRVYNVPLPHLAGSLENILNHARRRWSFVDFSTAAEGPGTSWMFQDVHSRSWGVNPETIQPRAFYDAVLFIHTATPPRYLAW